MRSGFVPVVGRPNVGKSTLVNALVGRKVAITSTRPQTTRNAIRGIVTGADEDGPAWQLVLVDTPGIHKPRTELGARLNTLVYGTLGHADAVVFVIDATQPVGPGDRLIAQRLAAAEAEVVVAVNKVDRAGRPEVASQLGRAAEWDFSAYVPVSALHGQNLVPLADELVARLPEGPLYFPPDLQTDQPEEHLVAELVREQFLELLRDELPHSLAVVTEDINQRDDGLVTVTTRLVVERDSQRGIVIGKGGAMLEQAGTRARAELEALFGARVHLELRVAVEPDWQRRPQLLDRLGFGA